MKRKYLILNGPNLNLLGVRNTELYGSLSLPEIIGQLRTEFPQCNIDDFQSNHEGLLLDVLHKGGFTYDGIVFNPGAYTHTSIALRDAVEAIGSPVIEVHISDIYQREAFRQKSYLEDVCLHRIIGKGTDGYKLAIQYFEDKL